MGNFFGGGSNGRVNNPPTPDSALRIQSSVNGQPIPIGHGQNRLAGNVIWYDGFLAIPHSSAPPSAGKGVGGGGGKGSSGSTSYTYQTNVIFGIGEGPVDQIVRTWNNKTPQSLESLNFTAFDGSQGQAEWGFLASSYPNAALGYSSLAYTGADPLDLGDSAELPNLNWEVRWAISGAVSETYAVSAPYSFAAAYFSLASSVTELVSVPATSPYQIQAVSFAAANAMPVVLGTIRGAAIPGSASNGVVYQATGLPLAQVSATPAAGQYSVTASGLYTFSAADAGKGVILVDLAIGAGVNYAYRPTGTLTLGSATITGLSSTANLAQGQLVTHASLPPGTVINSVGSGSITVSQAATASAIGITLTVYGATLTQVLGTPGQGQYSLSVTATSYGVYSFAAADAGQIVVITDVPDADPSVSLTDFLANPRYGCGFPAANIGDLSTLQNYAYAAGLFISPVLVSSQSANDYFRDFSSGLNGEFVWSAGLLTFVPYGDQTITGNGKTYTAPSAPLYRLNDDDFLPNEGTSSVGSSAFTSDDPVVCVRKRQSDALNDVKLEYLDRGNSYNPAIVEAKDEAAIVQFGLRPADTKQLHFFCLETAALASAQLQLGRQQVRNVFSFTLPWYFILLDPMDIVAVTDAGLGLNGQWVRIVEITENQQDWSLTITAEEYLGGTGSVPVYGSQPRAGYVANYNLDPGSVNPPVFFEPTDALAGGLQLWVGLSGTNTQAWGGANVYVSRDGDSYKLVGQKLGPSRMGALTVPLPAAVPATTGATIDTTSTLAVDLVQSSGQLLSGTQADMLALNTLCVVGNEALAYQTATLASGNLYDLTILNRGAYGTAIATHAVGTPFLRIDGGVFEYPFDQTDIGSTLYLKFVSFNLWGGALQDLADVEPFTHTLQGSALASPLPDVANLTSSYIGGLTQLAWSPVADFRNVDYEIRLGASFNTGQFIGRTPNTNFQLQAGDGIYWVSAHASPLAGLQVYSESAASIEVQGATLVRNVVAGFDEQALGWKGSLAGSLAVVSGDLATGGGGNILTDADWLGTANTLFYGGAVASGTYTVPTGHIINTGRAAASYVVISYAAQGSPLNQNILTDSDWLGTADILGFALSANINVQPQIGLSNDGATYSWQNYQPGQYNAEYFQIRLQIASTDTQTQALVSALKWSVDMPDRVDQYSHLSIPAAGRTLAYQPLGTSSPVPFNGGPGSSALPSIQVTWTDGAAGDVLAVTGQSLGGCTIEILNGGVGVARTGNITVQGY